MGLTTIVYTYLGGMSAVIWTDVIQLVIYLVGAGLAARFSSIGIPGGWSESSARAPPPGSSRCSTFTVSLTPELHVLVGRCRRRVPDDGTHGRTS